MWDTVFILNIRMKNNNMQNITIRKATQLDLTQVLTLIKELAHYEKAPNEVTLTIQQFEKDWENSSPFFHILVAEYPVNNRISSIVGIALYFFGYSTWKGKRVYLDDIIVTEKMRGKGIGKLLFDQLIEECKINNAKQLMWSVLDWNETALNFYKKYNAELDPGWITGKLAIDK